MRRYLLAVILSILLTSPGASSAQIVDYDTLRVMTYNVLNYGFPATPSCPSLLTESKHAWLRTVLRYADPDILGLEKMAASPASFTSDTIVMKVLDSVCAGCYGHTPYTNHSGYDKENMLYYKTAKIGWLSTTTIYSGDSNISDINLHQLYYKSPTLALTHDTIFLNIILVHLESGSGSAAERATEISGAMSWLNSHIHPGNYIFMGDFNTQSSSESCFQQLISSPDSSTLFFDPVDQPGDWDSDPTAFAHYLTQSTRTSDPGDCGATGGLNDRFDHILCTRPLIEGLDSLMYISGSFDIIGQDGQHTGRSIIASPSNTSVPASVLDALYYMSEHLPVMLRLGVGHAMTDGISLTDDTHSLWSYDHLVGDALHIRQGLPASGYTATIYNTCGQRLLTTALTPTSTNTIPTDMLPQGMYLLQICADHLPSVSGRFVKR